MRIRSRSSRSARSFRSARSSRSIVCSAGAALLLAACAPPPEPARPAPSRTLGSTSSSPELIISFRRQLAFGQPRANVPSAREAVIRALRDEARRSQAAALALLGAHGVQPRLSLWLSNVLVAAVPAALIPKLAALPEVERIDDDALLAEPEPSSAGGAPPWNLSAIRAPELWATGQQGAGVVVAALDTGVDAAHPDLAGSWRSAAGWLDPYGEHPTPTDVNGHGTQTMGLIVGGSGGGAPIGAAPAARWIAAKIFNDAGVASYSAIHQALQWTLDPDGDPSTDDAADVVNNSWGFVDRPGVCDLEFERDLEALRAAGISVVFAAGNSGPAASSSLSPANNPSAFAVGAVDATLLLQSSSSRGPDACGGAVYPELVAPGVSVRSADLTLGGVIADPYAVVSGTSFAAPHVAGALALLRSAHPIASVAQLEQALTESATDLGAQGPDDDFGAGLPDLVAAEARLADLVATPSCGDGDGDGFFAEPGCGTALDCDDGAAAIHPGACDIKADGIDQDCDGADRQKGGPCPSSGGDPSTSGVEGQGSTCTDGQDNDQDGQVDCADPDCARNKRCR